MKLHKLAAAAALAVMSLQAQAVTYTFGFAGTKTHLLDAYECPGTVCGDVPIYVTSAWSGTGAVTLNDGYADGLFTSDNPSYFLRVSLANELLRTDYPYGSFYVSIRDGVLTDLGGRAGSSGNIFQYSFSGGHVSYDQQRLHHYGPTTGEATLSFPTPVPEPETWALLVAGLGAVGMVRRRKAPLA